MVHQILRKKKLEVKSWVKFSDALVNFDSFHMALHLWNSPLDGRKHSLCIIKLAIIKFMALVATDMFNCFYFHFLNEESCFDVKCTKQ